MADTQSILISVFIFTVIASLLRVNSILLVYQQRREPPEHRQSEPLMIGHKYYFLPLVSLQVIASVSVASTLFPLALRGIDHFLTPFFASTVAISMVGQCAWWSGQWNPNDHLWQLFSMFIGLVVTLAVFLVGALVYEKDQMKSIVGIIMISIAISFFRIWMILKLVVFIRRNRTSLIAQQILITSWIEVSFALAIPAACAVFAYFDGLRFGTTHLVILGIISLGTSLHDLCANLWFTFAERRRLMELGWGVLVGMTQLAQLPQPDEEDVELTQTHFTGSV